MANLLVEIGNTALKAAWSEGVTLGKTFRYQGERKFDFIVSLTEKQKPEVMVVASVSGITASEERKLRKACCELLLLDSVHKDILKDHELPEYLSYDRAAALVATRYLFKGKACTIVDLGTTMTVDYLSGDGVYEGGNISLGCITRFKALNRYSRTLPLLNTPENPPMMGMSVESSVEAGVISGIMFEIQGYIAHKPENLVVFTGGDANYFAKNFKNSIFVVCNLVLMGLALITVKYVEKKNK
ncbi:MAG: type III pantothenate kinase [Bacteroidales bacterium]|nr:type III pantothenate kinase [Bacteroidales bacterium]